MHYLEMRQLIEHQLTTLDPEARRLLEVGSVVGREFAAALVAAAVGADVVQVEEQCERLARRGCFLRRITTAEWPDGTLTTSYGFLHALYREVLSERVTAARRARIHQRIAERLEQAYGPGRVLKE